MVDYIKLENMQSKELVLVFVPKVLNTKIYDEIITVTDDDAFKYSKLVCKTDSCFVGISAGAALCAGVELVKRSESCGKNIVIIFPDSGDRYFSTKLFQE